MCSTRHYFQFIKVLVWQNVTLSTVVESVSVLYYPSYSLKNGHLSARQSISCLYYASCVLFSQFLTFKPKRCCCVYFAGWESRPKRQERYIPNISLVIWERLINLRLFHNKWLILHLCYKSYELNLCNGDGFYNWFFLVKVKQLFICLYVWSYPLVTQSNGLPSLRFNANFSGYWSIY